MLDEGEVNQRIATRVRELRTARALSLEGLAAASGVSRSMISLIERGETSATAVVLDKLGRGLGVTLASLLEPTATGAPPLAPPSPLVRREEQSTWQDPSSGYARRSLSPPGVRQSLQLAEVTFPPRARVAFETVPGQRQVFPQVFPQVFQQIWMLEGTMEIAHGDERHTLRQGDCLAMDLGRPNTFHNPTRKVARYLVALATSSGKGA